MKAVIYCTKVKDEYQGKRMEHMLGEKLLEIGLREEYKRNLSFEPRGTGEHGKPFFTLEPGIHYNISHSGVYVACILTGQEVGLDIQKHRPVNMELTLRRMLPEQEKERILALDEAKKEQEFFRQWVLREAYIKWTGEGLSRDLRTISMEDGWHEELTMPEGYSGAVWAKEPLEITWKQVEVRL